MKLTKHEAELGEWYTPEAEPLDYVLTALVYTVALGVILLVIELTGLADSIINYFNA